MNVRLRTLPFHVSGFGVVIALGVALASLPAANEVRAVDTYWNNNTGANWDTDALWNTGAEPTAGDAAFVGGAPGANPAHVTITLAGEVASRLTVGNVGGDVGQVTMTGGGLAVSSDSWVGRFGTGTVNQSGGAAAFSNSLSLGRDSTGNGTYNISSAATLSANNLYVGHDGPGLLDQSGTSTITVNKQFIMGLEDGALNNTYNISGGTLNAGGAGGASREFVVGNFAGVPATTSTVNQTGGAVSALGGGGGTDTWAYIGRDGGATGIYNISGGSFNSSNRSLLAIGQNGGTGELNQSNAVSPTTVTANELWIGWNSGSNGEYNLTNGTLNVNDRMGIGRDSGTGTFTQDNGTATVTSNVIIADGGTGTVTVNGGTFNANSSIEMANNGGTGTLNVNGGNVNVGANITNGTGTATINISGGNLVVQGGTAGSVAADTLSLGVVGNGAYSQGGTQNVSVGTFSLGDQATRTGTYTLAGSGTLTMTNESWIGRFGTGNFTQSGTTTVNAGVLRFGRDTPGVGNYTLNAGTLNASELTLGYDGIGHFVQHGGAVNVTNDFRIRQNAGAGSSSYTMNGGTLDQTTNDFIVGGAGGTGVATFTQNGGTVTTNKANAGSGDPLPNNWTFVGLNGQGVYNITGGTLDADNSTMLAIGRGSGGDGKFNQSNATSPSIVDARELWIGQDSATGEYNLSAGTLNVDDRLGTGRSGGTGTFSQSGGTAHVTNNVIIAEGGAGTNGTVTVSGGTLNANSSVVLANGAGSTGTLNVNGGNVNVGANITNGTGTATINISGGNLVVQSGTAGSVAADTLSLGVVGNGAYSQGGTQNVSVGTFSLGDQATRTGTYTLAGSGTLTMTNESWIGRFGTGNFTQSGTTTVNAGVLRFGRDTPGVGNYTLNAGTLNASELTIGYDGIGHFVQHGGAVNVTNDFRIRQNAGAGSSSYTMNGGTLDQTNNDFIVGGAGGAGVATFTQNGGTVTTNKANAGSGDPLPNNWTFVGLNGQGVYNITGGTLDADNSTMLAVGYGNGGDGTINQNNNTSPSIVDARELWIGQNNATGEYNLSAGTLNVDDRLGLGREAGSEGTMNISGGTVTVAGAHTTVGESGLGTVNMTGGLFNTTTLNVGVVSGGNNLFDQDAGDVNVSQSLIIASNANSRGTYDISGGTLDVTSDISVGLNGGTGANPARFNVSGSAAVTANRILVGQNALSNGEMNVSDTSTINSTGGTPSMRIGENGTGVLNQSGGTINMPWVTIGTNSGGNGTYNISGGTLNATEFHAGRSGGTGTVFQSGGDVNANWVGLGASGNGTGTYNISAGTLDVTTSLDVGGNLLAPGVGTGTLEVSGTGAVTTGDLRVAPTLGSVGTVTQSGGTINVTNPTTYSVGNNGSGVPDSAGNGTVNQMAGATNVTGNMVLGDNPTTGPVANFYNLSGGTLQFGDTLTLGAGAHHQTNATSSTLTVNADAAFNFTGGTLLDVSNINTANGNTGTFHQNGTTALWEIGQQDTGPAGLTTLNGNLLQSSGTIAFDVFGYDVNNTPWDTMDDMINNPIDLLIVNGDAQLGGTVDVDFFTVLPPVFGDVFPLMKITGDAIIDPTFHIDGGFFRVVPDGMGNFTLQAIVPEPGSVAMWSLLALAAGGFAARMRGRRRA